MTTDEKFFSFVVKTEFDSKHRFDQCGVVMYLDSENWLKATFTDMEMTDCQWLAHDGQKPDAL